VIFVDQSDNGGPFFRFQAVNPHAAESTGSYKDDTNKASFVRF